MAFRSVPNSARRGGRDDVRVVESTKAGLAMQFPSPTRFLADRRGNVAMMYALILPVLMFGTGFAIDYTHAMQVQTKLDAAADAAVLAALTPSMMQQSNATAQTAATRPLRPARRTPRARSLAADTVVTVTVTNPTGSPLVRNVTVSYTAAEREYFRRRPRLFGARHHRQFDRQRLVRGEHEFLPLARQFAVDGPAGDASRHQFDGLPHPGPRRLRLRLPPRQHRQWRYLRKPVPEGRHLQHARPSAARRLDVERHCTLRRRARSSTIIALARHNCIQLRLDALNTGIGDLTAYAEQFRTQQAANPPDISVRRLFNGFVVADRHGEHHHRLHQQQPHQ